MPERVEDSTLELNEKLKQVECSGLTRKQVKFKQYCKLKNYKPALVAKAIKMFSFHKKGQEKEA